MSAHRWTTHAHAHRCRARAALSCNVYARWAASSSLLCVLPHPHPHPHTHARTHAPAQTVAVFLCQCLMRGWESGDLTAVKSSCSLELPPVPIRSLKTTTHRHTQTHTRNMQTHLTNCIHWFSHPVAPLSVFGACKQLTVAGWDRLLDRSSRDQGNINWYIWYSSPACRRRQRRRHCQGEWSLSASLLTLLRGGGLKGPDWSALPGMWTDVRLRTRSPGSQNGPGQTSSVSFARAAGKESKGHACTFPKKT